MARAIDAKVTLLLSPAELGQRTRIAAGTLSPLAHSLRSDMERVLREAPAISGQKAMLTRNGGRCSKDGSPLEFDPYSPHAHRCPTCGTIYTGEQHHRWWLMFAQLWRAERAVHAAALHALNGEEVLAAFARATLDEYGDRYARYPLDDNVLGPSRPFFSTYLESIWLLQLCIGADLLDAAGAGGTITDRFRDRVVIPSAELIRSYDEGESNRQLWNNAALMAAGRAVNLTPLVDHAVHSPSGLIAQLSTGLLSDGSWYEGENYHLFSHRGLWYGVTMAEVAGYDLPEHLLARFQSGFSTPFLTAYPDLVFPARRDSQYGASLRQWRTAESCELGLARELDPRLTGALAALYAPDIPRADTGRWRATAEAERNEPPTQLSRADLGWRSLLFARESLPQLAHASIPSALLEGQGIGVVRRENGRAYVALDYGHHGGGHGHPDRLNVLLANGSRRILDDMGTGSYVDRSLHWYRSTLAHNAPLVNGRSQPRTSGTLLAWDERHDLGWICASAQISEHPPVAAQRALTVTSHALIDELRWSADETIRIELPLHVSLRLESAGEWRDAVLDGGDGLEDGFEFVQDARFTTVPANEFVRLVDDDTGATLAWSTASVDAEWWTAVAPGPPGSSEKRFLLVRMCAPSGRLRTVWSWSATLRDVYATESRLVIIDAEGSTASYEWRDDGVHLDRSTLTGFRYPRTDASLTDAIPQSEAPPTAPPTAPHPLPYERDLGEPDYRTSEHSWSAAGQPRAHVRIDAPGDDLEIRVAVRKAPLFFRAADAPDPELDNEHPDIHSDGVQFHLWCKGWREPAAWLAVPSADFAHTRLRRTAGDALAPTPLVTSREIPGGYEMLFVLPRTALAPAVSIDVLVNDMSADRLRRRGQLVLSGARGDRVYLRGDRQPLEHFVRVLLPT